ncbi:hypothetical protein E2C01_083119 [Portunus trituberculatus]|uniref:Uncharacterized protein n=1 Tax=Portunus trituberculatus TaxID=210409 RepID=A0A5B7IRM1_PORTR|nr:hypothetical protein [Portunus trituberculatus]
MTVLDTFSLTGSTPSQPMLRHNAPFHTSQLFDGGATGSHARGSIFTTTGLTIKIYSNSAVQVTAALRCGRGGDHKERCSLAHYSAHHKKITFAQSHTPETQGNYFSLLNTRTDVL